MFDFCLATTSLHEYLVPMADSDAGNSGNAQEIFIIPEGRRIEKSIGCYSCIHFQTGARVFEEWQNDPAVKKMVSKVKGLVQFTGLKLRGFDEGNAALVIANMMGKGMSEVEARLTLEKQKIQAATMAVKQFGWDDPMWADQRLEPIRKVAEGLQTGKMGVCEGKGVNGNGDTLGRLDPIFSGYHCHKWSGRDGFSVAVGAKPLDMLPAEMAERAEEHAKKA
jgi:hypothetical protein